MRSGVKKLQRRSRGVSALELLEAHLKTPDEAAWYAERLERLGTVMFGELWRSDAPQPESANTETS